MNPVTPLKRLAVALAIVSAAAACTNGQFTSNSALQAPGKNHDAEFPVPAPPALSLAHLQSIDIDQRPSTSYAVDTSSVVGSDEVIVQYAFVITSSSGVRNISYEAMRCDRTERKLLAIGQPDGKWAAIRSPTWQPIGSDDSNPARKPLFLTLCSGGALARDIPRRLARINDREFRQKTNRPYDTTGY